MRTTKGLQAKKSYKFRRGFAVANGFCGFEPYKNLTPRFDLQTGRFACILQLMKILVKRAVKSSGQAVQNAFFIFCC